MEGFVRRANGVELLFCYAPPMRSTTPSNVKTCGRWAPALVLLSTTSMKKIPSPVRTLRLSAYMSVPRTPALGCRRKEPHVERQDMRLCRRQAQKLSCTASSPIGYGMKIKRSCTEGI